jgi:hypothetical protein
MTQDEYKKKKKCTSKCSVTSAPGRHFIWKNAWTVHGIKHTLRFCGNAPKCYASKCKIQHISPRLHTVFNIKGWSRAQSHTSRELILVGTSCITAVHAMFPLYDFGLQIHNFRPPLWSSVHSSWLQIEMSGFDSWRYQICCGFNTPPRRFFYPVWRLVRISPP